MGLDYFASSPARVLPQNQSPSPTRAICDQGSMSSDVHMTSDDLPKKRIAPRFPSPPSMNYLAKSCNNIAGRKRSRDDTIDDDNHDGSELEASTGPVHTPESTREPVYGPGMTLIHPEYAQTSISAESQSGTWLETRSEALAASACASAVAAAAAAEADRPRLPARKSSRRLSVDERANSGETSDIDPIVLRLGIGWKRMSEAQASAVAGDEAFIRNQYGAYIQSPKILLYHEGMNLYVVRNDASDMQYQNFQWWIFQENLKSCRLLCYANEEDVLRRLGQKTQDERGNWIPNIIADGQIIYAKDSAPSPKHDSPFSNPFAESGEVVMVDA